MLGGYYLYLLRYLAELVLGQQPLPRRQEAESLKFSSGGTTQTALVTHEEVQEWATGSRKAIMCSISHAWETREHPDPCRQGTGSPWDLVFFSITLFGTQACHYFPLWFPRRNGYCFLGLFGCLVFFHVFSVCCRNARKCAVAFCLRMWCVTCSRLITLTNPLAKWVGVVCNTSGVEPTNFVDLPCSLFIS